MPSSPEPAVAGELNYASARPTIEPEVMDAARLELLRRRVVWFACTVGVLLIVLTLLAELAIREAHRPARLRVQALSPAVGGAVLIIVAATKLRRRTRTMSLRDLIRRPMVIVVVTVVMQIPASRIVAGAISDMLRQAGLQHVQIGVLVPLLVSMLSVHVAASLILPWSFKESTIPVLVIALMALLASPAAPDPWPARMGGLLALLVMGVPGMLICWFRFSRLRQAVELRFLAGRYSEVQRDLAYARRIHEKVFPQRIDNGPVLFDFRYQPMRQIGGDFVDVIRETREDGAGGAVTVVLVDVTGHGIAAALAVNRLHGEIKRALAQGGGGATQPGKIIASLNEYVHLTLANEGVFATALVARLDPVRGELRWASAGHPPAFLRRGDGDREGRIERLDATAMLLGPLEPAEFDACEAGTELNAGDVLIAYTDGAIECRNRDDRQLGLDGFQTIVDDAFEAAQGNSSAALDRVLQSLAAHRWGAADDDTLVLAATVAGVQTNCGRADEQIAAPDAEAVSSEARP